MDYRSDDAAWRSAWTAGLILLASLLLAPTAAAQQTPSSCAPVSRHGGRGVLVPSFPDASTNPKLAASLTLGYRQLYQQHLYGPAAATLDRALTAATAAANPCAQALALYALGSNAESNNFKDALNLYDRALKLFTAINSPAGIAKSHFELGSIHSIKHETTAAVTELGLSASGFQAIGDTVSALNARVEAAYLQPPTDYPGLLAEAHADHFPCIEAQIQNLWSSQFNSANNFDEAMQHEVAADSLLTQCPEDSGMRATVQTSMGRMERQQGRPAFALQHYRIALRLQLQSRDLELVPQTYNAMAIAYDETKDWNHSLPLYRRGLAVAEQIHSQPYIDFLEANLGNAYTWSGQPKRGIPLLERASSHLHQRLPALHSPRSTGQRLCPGR